MRPLSDQSPKWPSAGDGEALSASQTPSMTFTVPVDESALDDALQQPSLGYGPFAQDATKRHTTQPGPGAVDRAMSRSLKHGDAQPRSSTKPNASSAHHVDDYVDNHDWDSGRSSPKRPRLSFLEPAILSSGTVSVVSGASSPVLSDLSLLEETGSQGLSTSEELEPESTSYKDNNSSTVQLEMPSLNMPDRRPFTEDGKRIGRLKVLLAGDSGRCP